MGISFHPINDLTNVCLEKGIIPTPEDIDKLIEIFNSRLDEMGYYKIIEDTITEYYIEWYKGFKKPNS